MHRPGPGRGLGRTGGGVLAVSSCVVKRLASEKMAGVRLELTGCSRPVCAVGSLELVRAGVPRRRGQRRVTGRGRKTESAVTQAQEGGWWMTNPLVVGGEHCVNGAGSGYGGWGLGDGVGAGVGVGVGVAVAGDEQLGWLVGCLM